MMKPMTKKILLGAPAVALSAALACTMVACGGGGGEQSESGGDAAASKSAYESQKIEVEGFTVESLADGTYYRGEFYEQDGFWLRVRITNTSDKPLTASASPRTLLPATLNRAIVSSIRSPRMSKKSKPRRRSFAKTPKQKATRPSHLAKALSGCISGSLTTTITDLLPSNSRMTYRAAPTPA